MRGLARSYPLLRLNFKYILLGAPLVQLHGHHNASGQRSIVCQWPVIKKLDSDPGYRNVYLVNGAERLPASAVAAGHEVVEDAKREQQIKP